MFLIILYDLAKPGRHLTWNDFDALKWPGLNKSSKFELSSSEGIPVTCWLNDLVVEQDYCFNLL